MYLGIWHFSNVYVLCVKKTKNNQLRMVYLLTVSPSSEMIIEAALCKSVLKPLREAVYNGLKDIHSHAGNLKKLKENQQVVQGTTTTDLGVTTSVPEMAILEKIHTKLGNLHQEYSPQKKIDLLLKTCKIIYESMSVGSPGGFLLEYCELETQMNVQWILYALFIFMNSFIFLDAMILVLN